MDKTVICINDKNLPQGAKVTEGEEYTIVKEFINQFDQRTYILKETINEGMTSKGLHWFGYNAERFRSLTSDSIKKEEYQFALN
jgi:hypothetical protein